MPDRAKFDAEELAVCLSHYDLGKIISIHEFHRGSSHAPKVIIEAERGKFLFKRRARVKDDPARVHFSHEVQLMLLHHNFPLPRLIPTRKDGRTALIRNGMTYELFDYIDGAEYDGSTKETFEAGRVLGLYHRLLVDFRSSYEPATGSYHGARAIHAAIQNAVSTLPAEAKPTNESATETIRSLDEAYTYCAKKADTFGLEAWPGQIVHGDWHPGNLLFREDQVVAALDFDSARLHQRVIDLANGALQFSITGGGSNPNQWPADIDVQRFGQFLAGYDSANVISKREIQALPYLMCEAMIAEAVLPIAATGMFGRIHGFPFLQMIENKVVWILANLEALQNVLRT